MIYLGHKNGSKTTLVSSGLWTIYKLKRKFCAMICDVLIGLTAQLDVETAVPVHALDITETSVKPLWRNAYWKESGSRKELIIETIIEGMKDLGTLDGIIDFFS
jgi:hypothetical protein